MTDTDTDPYPWLTGEPEPPPLRASRLVSVKLTDEDRTNGWWCLGHHGPSEEARVARVVRISTGGRSDLWLCDDCVDALIDGTYADGRP